jgi:hypothetical protein
MAIVGLMTAVAIFIAVHLIEAVLPMIIVIAALVAVGYVTIMIIRHRKSHW